jgi:hypothetical protein
LGKHSYSNKIQAKEIKFLKIVKESTKLNRIKNEEKGGDEYLFSN